jgi:Mrp family chromosome partitioning ATPase/capsular polysaccharide biosynthesis protein
MTLTPSLPWRPYVSTQAMMNQSAEQPTGQPADQITARQFLQPVARRWWMILLSVAIITGATYGFYASKPDQYRTSTSVFVKGSELAAALGGAVYVDDQRNTANQAQLLQSEAVARKVAENIGYEGDPRNLLGQVSATPQEDSDFITIEARGGSPEETRDIANGFAEEFIALRSDEARQRLQRALTAAQQELRNTPDTVANQETRAALQSRVRQLNAVAGLPTGTAEQVDPAPLPAASFEPRPKRAAMFAFVIGLILSVAAAFGLERLDRRIKLLEDLERLYRRPLLGVLPRSNDVAPVQDGVAVVDEGFREPFRSLRVNVDLASIDRKLNVLTVVSAVPNEGKSTVIRNLALAYAEAGLRVAVVESDLRKPMLARTFNVEPRPGITDVLAGGARLHDAFKPVRAANRALVAVGGAEDRNGSADGNGSEVGNGAYVETPAEGGTITLVTSGPEPPNPPVLLASDPFRAIVDELRDNYDLVLLDTAPLLVISDAIPLVEMADGVLVVSRFNRTTRDAARRLTTVLDRVPNINVLGVVANEVPARDVGSGTYSYYGYRQQ